MSYCPDRNEILYWPHRDNKRHFRRLKRRRHFEGEVKACRLTSGLHNLKEMQPYVTCEAGVLNPFPNVGHIHTLLPTRGPQSYKWGYFIETSLQCIKKTTLTKDFLSQAAFHHTELQSIIKYLRGSINSSAGRGLRSLAVKYAIAPVDVLHKGHAKLLFL
jgi:hypothetical protein